MATADKAGAMTRECRSARWESTSASWGDTAAAWEPGDASSARVRRETPVSLIVNPQGEPIKPKHEPQSESKIYLLVRPRRPLHAARSGGLDAKLLSHAQRQSGL